MTFFPDVKSLDKLLKNDWKTFVYGEQSETWQDKFHSFTRETWHHILIFLESRGKEIQNYWPLYAAIFVGSCMLCWIILATYKSHRYIGTINKTDKCEKRVKQEIRTEESRIISDDGKVEPTHHLDLDNATAIPEDNDHHSRHDSSVSSITTVVAAEGNEQDGDFLRNFINSIQLGDDTIDQIISTKDSRENDDDNKETLEVPESTRRKVDSNNCKHFYVLTSGIDQSKNQKSYIPGETILPHLSILDDAVDKEEESSLEQSSSPRTAEQEEIDRNESDNCEVVKSNSPKVAAVKTVVTNDGKLQEQTMNHLENSILVSQNESNSICCADEILSRISDTRENILSINTEKCELSTIMKIDTPSENLERLFSNLSQKLPRLDLSPISREPGKIDNKVDIMESAIRTDSKHRFRSLSHDNRPISSGGFIDNRRGCSVSPPARDKNKKQRTVKEMQSKIPTLSPLAHRSLHQHPETDGAVAETANQIRSVLLRKLKEVWENHPRDRTPSPNRSINPSIDNSVYYTPENVSRIPLLRRSPRYIDTKDQHIISARVSSQSDRTANHSSQSRSGNTGITSNRNFPDKVSEVPMHSTPKTSPTSRGKR